MEFLQNFSQGTFFLLSPMRIYLYQMEPWSFVVPRPKKVGVGVGGTERTKGGPGGEETLILPNVLLASEDIKLKQNEKNLM